MKNVMQRIIKLESIDKESTAIKMLENRINKLEEIIESMGYYFPKPKK